MGGFCSLIFLWSPPFFNMQWETTLLLLSSMENAQLHIIQYYVHLGLTQSQLISMAQLLLKLGRTAVWALREVFPSIKLYRRLSTNEQQHWRGGCLEGSIKFSEPLTLKTVAWFRFVSHCLPKESYEHSLILIIPSNSHVFIRMLFWSCLREIFWANSQNCNVVSTVFKKKTCPRS